MESCSVLYAIRHVDGVYGSFDFRSPWIHFSVRWLSVYRTGQFVSMPPDPMHFFIKQFYIKMQNYRVMIKKNFIQRSTIIMQKYLSLSAL